MALSGRFRDPDAKELNAILDRDIVNRKLLGFGARADAVVVRPADGGASPALVRIGTSGAIGRHPTMNVVPPSDMPFDVLTQRVAAAGVTGGEPRKTMGQVMYDFPPGTGTTELVAFALGVMRALGVDSDEWEYETETDPGA